MLTSSRRTRLFAKVSGHSESLRGPSTPKDVSFPLALLSCTNLAKANDTTSYFFTTEYREKFKRISTYSSTSHSVSWIQTSRVVKGDTIHPGLTSPIDGGLRLRNKVIVMSNPRTLPVRNH